MSSKALQIRLANDTAYPTFSQVMDELDTVQEPGMSEEELYDWWNKNKAEFAEARENSDCESGGDAGQH